MIYILIHEGIKACNAFERIFDSLHTSTIPDYFLKRLFCNSVRLVKNKIEKMIVTSQSMYYSSALQPF